jgi:hypothetical protein
MPMSLTILVSERTFSKNYFFLRIPFTLVQSPAEPIEFEIVIVDGKSEALK